MGTLLSLSAVLFISVLSSAQSQPQLNLMPMPSSVQQGAGELQITPSFSVAVTGTHDPSLDSGAQRFSKQLSQITGIPFRTNTAGAPTLEVHADHGRETVQKLGEDESYELTVTASGAKITAPTPLGALHGLQISCNWCRSLPAASPCRRSPSKISPASNGAACSLTSAATSSPSTSSSAISTAWLPSR